MSARERNMLILLGVIVLLAGGFLLFTMLGGDEPEQQAAPTPTASPPPIPAEPGTGVGEPEPQEPPRAITFFGGRDPFVPLVVEAAGGGGTTPTEAQPAAPTETTGTTGGEVPTGGEPVEPVPEGAEESQADEGGIVGGKRFDLVGVVDQETVEVEVDGDALTLTEGQRFRDHYQLVSVAGTCARFLFGDDGFTLCRGAPPK
ncbi:MAG TPA: hypothetical protein VHH92_01255 [Actinomycetota bacterium]|nr:hypothetical protein [Actinomycetota bacterium]